MLRTVFYWIWRVDGFRADVQRDCEPRNIDKMSLCAREYLFTVTTMIILMGTVNRWDGEFGITTWDLMLTLTSAYSSIWVVQVWRFFIIQCIHESKASFWTRNLQEGRSNTVPMGRSRLQIQMLGAMRWTLHNRRNKKNNRFYYSVTFVLPYPNWVSKYRQPPEPYDATYKTYSDFKKFANTHNSGIVFHGERTQQKPKPMK